MKNQRKYSLRKFIKRAIFITVVLAIIEGAILFILKSGKNTSNNPPENKLMVLAPAEKVADDTSNFHGGENADRSFSNTNPENDMDRKNNSPPTDSVPGKNGHSTLLVVNDSIQKSMLEKDSTGLNNVVSTTRLTRSKMMQVLHQIAAAKRRNHNKLNCVQVRKTVSSNVVNALAMADFLQSKGFIISGRMTIAGEQPGISINAKSGCIVVTVGSL